MTVDFKTYQLSDDVQRIDFPTVTEWLSGTYWSPGIGQAEVERAARHSSLVVSAWVSDGEQVGYARVASDKTRFGYIMDVFVVPGHRGHGLGQAMVRFAMDHPEHRLVYQWLLATQDAHGVYEKVGFSALPHPERLMGFRKPWPRPLSAESAAPPAAG